MRRLPVALIAAGVLFCMSQASAETLLVDRVQQENAAALPARGMRMADVERRFGAPIQRMDPRGGQKRKWPAINRWTYPNFVVYFEKDRVVDAVLIHAGSNEVGPKPPVK